MKEIKSLIKQLRLPAPKPVKRESRTRCEIVSENYYTWSKDGGYADAVLAKVFPAAAAAGFSEPDTTHSGSPDGNVVGRGNVMVKGDWRLKINSSYGVTSRDNYFYIELERVKK